ncbi:MAG TPA: phosphodiesterase [Firmicutes bacterium]|nr:MAG: phosphodiesterase [Candidatus Omnitrophota bacterium]HDD64561.1 phosphodiesterase [Bacillota bacterium]
MKIGIISDTHGSVKGWENAWKIIKDTDIIIHCGDILNHGPGNPLPEGYSPKKLVEILNGVKIPLLIVKGNCDSEVDQLFLDYPLSFPFLFSQIGQLRILSSHGHIFKEEEWLSLGKKWKIDILISGHTHLWKVEKKENAVILNPGSPSLPKKEPTVAVVDESLRKIEIFNVETGKVINSLLF